MLEDHVLADMAVSVQEFKEHGWTCHGQQTLTPQLSLWLKSGGGQQSVVPDHILNGEVHKAGNDLSRALTSMGDDLRRMRKERPLEDAFVAEMVAFIADGLSAPAEEGTGSSVFDRPEDSQDVAKDFASNPETKVQRIVSLIVATSDLVGGADIQNVVIPYSIEDGGGLAWGEPIIPDNPTGPIMSALANFVKEEADADR